MTYRDERDMFMIRAGRRAICLMDAQRMARDAITVQRNAERHCNKPCECDPGNGTKCASAKRADAAEARIAKIAGEYKLLAEFQGDPRGPCARLIARSGGVSCEIPIPTPERL